MTDVWQPSPPPKSRPGRRGQYDWDSIVESLKQRPGESLLIDDEARRGLASAIKRRKMTALQDPEWDFEVTTRNNDKEAGTCEVWMSARKREET